MHDQPGELRRSIFGHCEHSNATILRDVVVYACTLISPPAHNVKLVTHKTAHLYFPERATLRRRRPESSTTSRDTLCLLSSSQCRRSSLSRCYNRSEQSCDFPSRPELDRNQLLCASQRSRDTHELFTRREEPSATVCVRPILLPRPKVVPTDDALEARAPRVVPALSELEQLGPPRVAISQICELGVSEVEVRAFVPESGSKYEMESCTGTQGTDQSPNERE